MGLLGMGESSAEGGERWDVELQGTVAHSGTLGVVVWRWPSDSAIHFKLSPQQPVPLATRQELDMDPSAGAVEEAPGTG